jgi:Predicted methyltransferase (contains TPR repeat)
MNFEQFAEKSKWTFAKTMKESPHEYTLRKNCDSFEFDEAVLFIRANGAKESFKGYTYVVYYLNGLKYWTMGAPLDKTILINRTRDFMVYDKIADRYDSFYLDELSKSQDVIIKLCLENIEGLTLDIGCGTGLFLDLINFSSKEYLGIDPSEKMLNILHEKHPAYQIENVPMEQFRGSGFINVISLYGSISYIMPQFIDKVVELCNFGNMFLMFYKEGYSVKTHEKVGMNIMFYKYSKEELFQLFHVAPIEFYDYYIVTDYAKAIEILQGEECF